MESDLRPRGYEDVHKMSSGLIKQVGWPESFVFSLWTRNAFFHSFRIVTMVNLLKLYCLIGWTLAIFDLEVRIWWILGMGNKLCWRPNLFLGCGLICELFFWHLWSQTIYMVVYKPWLPWLFIFHVFVFRDHMGCKYEAYLHAYVPIVLGSLLCLMCCHVLLFYMPMSQLF